MKILAIETSSVACSAALLDGDEKSNTIIDRHELAPRQHTHMILPMLKSLLSEADITLRDIDAIAYGRGPGAFTGLRVASGVVQGISYAARLPVAQVSTLAALANGYHRESGQSRIVVANDARIDEIYAAIYAFEQGECSLVSTEQVISPQTFVENWPVQYDASSYAGVGSGWDVYKEQMAFLIERLAVIDTERLPMAKDVALLAVSMVKRGECVDSGDIAPVYLRDKVARKRSEWNR